MEDTYEGDIQALQSGGLQRPRWLDFISVFGARLDTEKARLIEAARAGLVEACPEDGLDRLGRDRLLPRYPSESFAVYRARLLRTFPIWKLSGTKNGLLEMLNAAFPGPIWGTLEWKEDNGAFAPSTWWAQFDVLCDANGFIDQWQIGDVHTIGEEDLIIGATLTTAEFALIERVILDFKPLYAFCRNLVITFPDGDVAFPIQAELIPS